MTSFTPTESENTTQLIQQFTDYLESADHLPIIKEYKYIVAKVWNKVGVKGKTAFFQTKTSFERVCFLLRELESIAGQHFRGAEKLGLATSSEEILQINGKSDGISKRYLSYGKLGLRERNKEATLKALTKSVFYAASPEQLSGALGMRCRYLHHLKLYDEAIEDGVKALRLPCPKSEIGKVHLSLASCYHRKKMPFESLLHYTEALTAFVDSGITRSFKYAHSVVKGLDDCFKALDKMSSKPYVPVWKCLRPKAPRVKEWVKEMSPKYSKGNSSSSSSSSSNAINIKLLSSTNCALSLKYTGTIENGWTLVSTRDVSAGDILMVEKPWVMSLWKERTKYCYFCCRRCHNLKPCSGCPHVGFCSEECEVNAKNPDETPNGGNKHIYDCHGLCPLITIGGFSTHIAFNSLAKVPMNKLLDYICSTGSYEVPFFNLFLLFPLMNIHNLSLSSFRVEEVTRHSKEGKQYEECAGYPMEWFDESENTFTDPSSTPRPKVIPASWVAACMLYHIMAARINAFEISESIRRNPPSQYRKVEEFGTAIYPTISLINHSCYPNVSIKFSDRGEAFLFASRPIHAGSEILLTYAHLFYLLPTKNRRDLLFKNYHFYCKCCACENDWNESVFTAPEKLICRNCEEVFLYQPEGCPKCKSLESVNIFNNLRNSVIPELEQNQQEGNYKFEDLNNIAEHINKALAVLQQPSSTTLRLHHFLDEHICRIYENQTIEQWVNFKPSRST
ncbi:unnamed protein product [Rodentolepis nana]|uniref:SET domain-containing protein n=1 Tax=Rodentolepis nana TaxID=102285 RepID=A0A0R3T2L9_RODNA|nr:unnamed protein product [Rodentolepis nana]